MSKKALAISLTILAIGVSEAYAASNKAAEHTLLQTGTRIRQLESGHQFGEMVLAGNDILWDGTGSAGTYKDLRTRFILAYMIVVKGEQSNERFKKLVGAFFPVHYDSIFTARSKALMREVVIAAISDGLGVSSVEYISVHTKGRLFSDYYYVYKYKNGKTEHYQVKFN